MPVKFLLGLLGLLVLGTIVLMPELATSVVLFVMYTNAAVVGYRFHGVPYLLAASVILLLLIPLVVYVVIRRRPLRWNPVLIPMFLLLCAQLISALFAYNHDIAFAQIQIYIVEGLILFFLVTNVVRTEMDVRRALWAIVLAGAFMGGIVLFQRATNTLDNNYGGFAQLGGQFRDTTEVIESLESRQAGPLGEQNNFATVMLATAPMAWFLMKHATPARERLLALISLGLIVAGIVLSYSRAAGAILLVMIPIMAFLSSTRLVPILLGGLLAFGVVTAVAPQYMARLATLEEITQLFQDPSEVSDRSLRGRASENLAAINMFLDHPIVGVGEANYPELYQQYAREIALDYRAERRPHNLYLGIAAEGGILGLLATLAIFFAVLADLAKVRLRYLKTNPAAATLASMMIVSLVGRMLMGLTLDLTYERYLWLLVALAATVAYLRPFESTAMTRMMERPLIPLPLSSDTTLLGAMTRLFRPGDATLVSPSSATLPVDRTQVSPSSATQSVDRTLLARETDRTILSSQRVAPASDATQEVTSPPTRSSDVTQDAGERIRFRGRDDETFERHRPGSSDITQPIEPPDFGEADVQGAEGE